MKKVFKIGWICLLLAFVFAPKVSFGQFFFFLNPMVGQETPDFTLDTLRKNKVNFKEFRDGQKTILFFWATWCQNCKEELKALSASQGDFVKQGIKLLIIDVGENKKTVEKYVKRHKLDFDVFLDEDQKVSEAFELMGVPTFVYINKKGIINEIQHGLLENYEEVLADESLG